MIVYKKCHVCGFLNEKEVDSLRCESCSKPLLPLGYFNRQSLSRLTEIEIKNPTNLKEDFLIKGLAVLWEDAG